MNDFVFDTPQWELELNNLTANGIVPAVHFLALMERESEESFEDAFLLMEERNVGFDVYDLPKLSSSAQQDLRLRREEELVAGKQLPGGLEENDPLRLYLEELAGIPAYGDPEALAERYLAGEEELRQQLMNSALSLVVERACEYVGRGVLLMDLIQEGSLALWQAIPQFRGPCFMAHCSCWIGRAMTRAIVRQARADGVGQRLRQAMEDYRSVDERLLGELGRIPTIEEIAEAMHISPGEAYVVRETLDQARSVRRDDPDEQESAMPEEEDQAVEDTAYFQMRQRISELLSGLEPEDAQILNLRFGLEGGLPLTPEQTARKLGMTPGEVTAREAAALMKLRAEG